jgi:ABC-type phosphate transport system permease subunit
LKIRNVGQLLLKWWVRSAGWLAGLLFGGVLVWLITQTLFNSYPITITPVMIAAVNTIVLVVSAACLAILLGVPAGIYIAEFRSANRWEALVMQMAQQLSALPGIFLGLFTYWCAIKIGGTPSAYIFLIISLMLATLPAIIRITNRTLSALPSDYRTAAKALGANQLEITFYILLPCAWPQLLSAILLQCGRIAGEITPLLLLLTTPIRQTAVQNDNTNTMPDVLTTYIYRNAGNLGADVFVSMLVLVLMVLMCWGLSLWVKTFQQEHRNA